MNGFTKKSTNVIKGIACILLIIHHTFYPSSTYSGQDVRFINEELMISIGLISKVCVSIFCFITGYGLYKSYQGKFLTSSFMLSSIKGRIEKQLRFYMFIYGISYVLLLMLKPSYIERYWGDGEKNLITFITNQLIDMVGLSQLFNSPTICGTWWYMSVAYLFVVITPIYIMIGKKMSTKIVLVISCVVPMLSGHNVATVFFRYQIPMILGIIFAEKDYFAKMNGIMKKAKALMIYLSLILLIIFLSLIRVNKTAIPLMLTETSLATCIILLGHFLIEKIPVINNILELLGKYSFAFFLSHTVILVLAKDIIFAPRYPILIILWRTILSIVVAMILEYVYNFLNSFVVNRREYER